jgi:hypothetical protein
MSPENPIFGQSDVVKLSDEDAAVALLERAVTGLWEVVNELTRSRPEARAYHCHHLAAKYVESAVGFRTTG